VDEALINDVKRYALLDLPAEELSAVKNHIEKPL